MYAWPKDKHKCPYNGRKTERSREEDSLPPYHAGTIDVIVKCGTHGWLCDMCKEDRADQRAERQATNMKED